MNRILTLVWPRCVTLGVMMLAILFVSIGARAQSNGSSVLTTFSEIKGLSPAEAGEGRPVRVEATVLFAHPSTDWFVHFLYDGTDGIYAKLKEWQSGLEAGDRVVVTGIVAPGNYAPIISEASLEMIDRRRELPEAVDAKTDGLVRGVYDSRLVSVAGVVRSAKWDNVHVVMELIHDTHRFRATVIGYSQDDIPRDLIGRDVSIRGVYAPLFNRNRQLTGFQLYVPGRENVRPLGEPLGEPFELRVDPISGILGYGNKAQNNQRVRSLGTVDLIVSDTVFYMSDGANGVRVESIEPMEFKEGEGVDVVGFAELGDFSPVLRDCQVRAGTKMAKTEAVATTADEASKGAFESRLISLSGRLVNHSTRGEFPVLTLQDSGVFFDVAMVGDVDGGRSTALKLGSTLRATGICVVEVDRGKQPIGFQVLVGDDDGLEVVSEPPWWTVRNTMMVVGALVTIMILVVAWGLTLQRRVSAQTGIIRDEFEQKAALQRQYQNLFENANDVVFTLNAEGRFSELNKAGERLLGMTREEARNQRFEDLVADSDQEVYAEVTEPNRKNTGERQAELRLNLAKDHSIEMEVSFRGVRRNGRLLGFEAIGRDLTERRKAQAQLDKAQQELVHASRQAGMAEVATGVLHNVGNVLNSVNVSGQTALELTKKFRLDSLDKVAALLDENRTQPEFLSADPKGSKLPEYLGQLATQLVSERETLQQELNNLLESVEHTKDIVAMQQAYAHTGGLRDSLSASELVEDAIRLNAGALTRHEMTLVREFAPTQKISVDRTRILQVLINLIRNAKYACDESPAKEKILTIAIAPSARGVRISVKDTGIGIPKENLTKIFAFGFTTRKEGHGFGLHSSALAAKEMGGELTAESEGLGKGATFHLDLPIRQQEDAS